MYSIVQKDANIIRRNSSFVGYAGGFRGGELPNSARFFSTFADVSKDNCTDLKGTFLSHLSLSRRSTIRPPRTQTI